MQGVNKEDKTLNIQMQGNVRKSEKSMGNREYLAIMLYTLSMKQWQK